jgi:hypothetical protein
MTHDAQVFPPFETSITLELVELSSVLPYSALVALVNPPLKHQERDLAPSRDQTKRKGRRACEAPLLLLSAC